MEYLEGHARGLDGSLERDVDLKLVRHELSRRHLEEGTVLVNDVDDGDWPDEEDAGFAGGVGRDCDWLDVVEHLALVGHAASGKISR